MSNLDKLLQSYNFLSSVDFADHPNPNIEALGQVLTQRLQESVKRLIPENVAQLDRQHEWIKGFDADLQAYDDSGMFSVTPEANALMSPKELRNNAPSMGAVIDELKRRPELLAKVNQGFVRIRPKVVGLSVPILGMVMGNAICRFKDEDALRSTDGTKLELDRNKPVWNSDEYNGADSDGRLVYDVKEFDSNPEKHQGKTKKELIEGSPFPGWQVVMVEDLPDIPRKGNGDTVGDRKQIEAGKTVREYLRMSQSDAYALEQGMYPEGWQSEFIAHIFRTRGEVRDDLRSGYACYCTGAYFPSSEYVPSAYWNRRFGRAIVGKCLPDYPSVDGSRFEVRVL